MSLSSILDDLFRSGVPYTDDLQERAETALREVSTRLDAADAAALPLATLLFQTAGVPVDYTDGTPPATGEGVAAKGALCIDTTNGFVYRNSGTVAHPAWTKLADVA